MRMVKMKLALLLGGVLTASSVMAEIDVKVVNQHHKNISVSYNIKKVNSKGYYYWTQKSASLVPNQSFLIREKDANTLSIGVRPSGGLHRSVTVSSHDKQCMVIVTPTGPLKGQAKLSVQGCDVKND